MHPLPVRNISVCSNTDKGGNDKNNRKNYQKLSLIIQLYLLESLVRITDKFPVNYLAIIELICSIVIFILLVLQLRSLKNN